MAAWYPSSSLLVVGIVTAVLLLGYGWWRHPNGGPVSVLVIGAIAACNGLIYRTDAEDAFITYRYALNLADGNGAVFNVHERVEGYSNFLWMCLLAAAHAGAGLEIEHVGRVLGLIAAVATVFATYQLGVVVSDGKRATSAAAALLLACAGPFAAYSMSGLETPLFALLVVLLTYALAREHPALAGGTAALATMTRPDGLVFVAVATIWLLVGADTRAVKTRALLGFLGAFGVLAVPWTVWRVSYYGHFVPNALVAKSGGIGILDQLRDGIDYMGTALLGTWPLLLVAITVGAVSLVLGSRIQFSRVEWLLASEALAFTGFLVVAGGDWMPASRLFAPVIPLAVLVIASAWTRATSSLSPERSTQTFGVLACISALLLLATSFWVEDQIPRIRLWRYQVEALASQGAWFDANLPERTEIATFANGALSYNAGTDKNIIDMLGLTDEHIAREGHRVHTRSTAIGHRAYDNQYIVRRRPDVIINYGGGFAGGPNCVVPKPFASSYAGASFQFPKGNKTGTYVNLYLRADRADELAAQLLRERGVVQVCASEGATDPG